MLLSCRMAEPPSRAPAPSPRCLIQQGLLTMCVHHTVSRHTCRNQCSGSAGPCCCRWDCAVHDALYCCRDDRRPEPRPRDDDRRGAAPPPAAQQWPVSSGAEERWVARSSPRLLVDGLQWSTMWCGPSTLSVADVLQHVRKSEILSVSKPRLLPLRRDRERERAREKDRERDRDRRTERDRSDREHVERSRSERYTRDSGALLPTAPGLALSHSFTSQ